MLIYDNLTFWPAFLHACAVRIARGDNDSLNGLAQYIIRSPFSIVRAEKFFAAITQHIPEKSFQFVQYVGRYSNRMRGDRRKQELEEREKRWHG